MKNLQAKESSVKLSYWQLIFALSVLLFSSLQIAQAQTLVTFAQFIERNGSQDFVFTNNTTNAEFRTISGGSPIFFRYQNISGLNASLQGFQDARLILNTSTTQPAALNSSVLTQPFDSTVSSIQVLRDTPTPIGVGRGTRRNLLTVTFSPAASAPPIFGLNNGNSATFSLTTPDQIITFTSDFLAFNNTTQRNLALSFSSVIASLTRGGGNFLQNFTAAGSGTFASNPPPVVLAPTAATVEIGGQVFSDANRGLRNARVTLQEADGATRTVLTGVSGHYRFPDVSAGQTVVISVYSKRYSFAPQVVNVSEEASNLNFNPEP